MIPVAAAGSTRLLRCAPFGVPVVPDVSSTGGTGSEARRGPPASPLRRTADIVCTPLSSAARSGSSSPATMTGASNEPGSSRWRSSRSMARTARLLAFDDFAHLRCGEAGVEVDDAESGLGCGDRQLDEVAMVAARDAEAFAASCAQGVQSLCELRRLAIQVCIRQRAPRVDDGTAVRRRERSRRVRRGRRGPPPSGGGRERWHASRVEQTRPADDVEERREPISQCRHRGGRRVRGRRTP